MISITERHSRNLFARAKHIYQEEGILALCRRVFVYLFSYESRTFYLSESTLTERNESDFMPRIKSSTVKIVSTNQQLDKLVDTGFDLSSHVTEAKKRLEKGAIALFIFVGKELACSCWVAMTEEAKRTFNRYPYRVDFANKEACLGGAWTNTKYRGNGLMPYANNELVEFLRKKGVTTVRAVFAERNNLIVRRAHCRYGYRMYARARYLSIMGLQFWKEAPLKGTLR